MRFSPLALFISIVLLSPDPAHASVLIRLDLKNLVAHSDAIVEAQVVSSRGFLSADRRSINTETTLRVERGVRGPAAGQTIKVRSLGGKVGEVRMHVAGAPRLRAGERVVLFLTRRQGHRWVLGMNQGVFDLLVGADGKDQVRQRLKGASLVQKTEAGLKPVTARPMAEELGRFLDQVRQTQKTCDKEPGSCRVR